MAAFECSRCVESIVENGVHASHIAPFEPTKRASPTRNVGGAAKKYKSVFSISLFFLERHAMFTFTNRVAVASLLALTALQMPRAHAQFMMPGVMRTGFYGGAAMFAPTYFNPSGYGTALMYVPSYYGYSSPYYSY